MPRTKTARLKFSQRRAYGMIFLAALCGWLVISWCGDAFGSTLVPAPQEEGQQEEGHEGENHEDENHEGEDHGDGDHAHDEDHHGEVSAFDYYLGADHLISHTQDKPYFELPSFKNEKGAFSLFGDIHNKSKKILIPQVSPWSDEHPLMKEPEGKLGEFLGPITFQPTKFVLLQLLAGLMVGGAFFMLGRKIQNGEPAKGRFWNMLEAGVVYIRDEVAKPAIGSADYKYFLPLLWTVFFFILTMNLMGMFPLLGTATGNISVTSALAIAIFGIVLFTGMKKLGVVGFWKAQAPHMDLPGAMKLPMTVGIWCIEVFGLFIKHMVLAVRLFANMFAGHLVLAVFVGFIGATWGEGILAWVVGPAAIGGSVAISLLEVLVAFIQAYVFTFLTALFIGAAVHPH